ncbi:hypothetical protein MHYP_G00351440 [Metynnis hypsauchen]
MTSEERFSVNEVLSHLLDHESDIEETVSETEDDAEDPDYEASSSDENETSHCRLLLPQEREKCPADEHYAQRRCPSTREDRKPQMVLDYNKTKGEVDNLDKVIATYSCRRMTAHWPLVIFFNIIDVSAYSAFVIWSEINKDWNSRKLSRRRIFLEKLGNALVKPHIERRRCLPRASTAAATVVRDIQTGTHTSTPPVVQTAGRKRGRCQVCPKRNDSKTSNTCVKCKKYVYKEHACTFCTSCVQ